ncbi:photosynthetic NDH subunit of subcomplex B 5, chloroplastic [Olea europaea subsp. europaea]|uniref:Photosynthetic NDH subunit of subcomplex B 5, chloroplastic n=1 Tax=Olea europaea subsp. europaea TaxID=158383 RepID=A0A8S0RDD2_OLEEU|nr:photosynthetic NDH subunit of subcomplex B 5, chloroplastic [Olea europaea subsp. europaea]
MATLPTLPTLSTTSIPKILSRNPESFETQKRDFVKKIPHSSALRIGVNYCKIRSTRLYAGLSEIEPDLNEDPVDRWRTNGIDSEDFKYGKYDDHHTYYEGDEKGSFWGSIAEDYAAIGPPTGFQGFISWLFLPAVAAGMYFNVPGEYLYIGAAIFTVIFCIIEMDKPSEPHNFEPQIYNMERGARDKLIADYNTMDIWDFNEKYGDLWDFTVKKDDIMKR